MRLGLISAGYPPDVNGIGDYTWWLAKTLGDEGIELNDKNGDTAKPPEAKLKPPVVVLTRRGNDHLPSLGVEIVPFFDPEHPSTFSLLPEIIETRNAQSESRIDWLVLQYNPFAWGKRGFCPWVPSALHRLLQMPGGPRIAVMFHETVVPVWPWKFTVMSAWQWPIFRSVCRAAEIAFVSTDRWKPQVKRVAPHLPVHHLPVGSNVPFCCLSQVEARRQLGIEMDALVLGIFGSAHLSRRLDWIAATLKEATRRRPERRTALLYVGPQGNVVRRACTEADLIDLGPLPSENVGACLRAMDAAISPFIDGMSTRLTSVISVLHHGIPVATTRTSWTDDVFLKEIPPGLLLSSATSADTFATETVDWLDQLQRSGPWRPGVAAFHDKFFAWPLIASTMTQCLSNEVSFSAFS
jgi:glycosyltransferase involved in cell wall biosynthesis